MKLRRFDSNPIIYPDMDDRMGDNINGPSLIRVPGWIENPLGKYYLYFAHHQGTYLRMAYADQLEGPWTMYRPGVMDLADSYFDEHIASPDVHVMKDSGEIRMYFHGCYVGQENDQVTRLATSRDGLLFSANSPVLGNSYWRAFRWNDYWYTLEMPGKFRRSNNGIDAFEEGPQLFTDNMRHSAVRRNGHILTVYYTNAHDCPEQILWVTIDLSNDWRQWTTSSSRGLIKPEMDWEGGHCALEPSERGSVHHPVRQLRDPCVFEENNRTYLLYAVAGESGIAIGELLDRTD